MFERCLFPLRTLTGEVSSRRLAGLLAIPALLVLVACGGDDGQVKLEAPVIEANPTSVTIRTTQSTTLSVAAKGVPTPTFQWRKDGVDLQGATSATLLISGATKAHEGSYTVVVSNLQGKVVSAPAVVTVETSLLFATPTGVGADAAGNLYVANSADHTLCKVTPAGTVTVLAGASGLTGSADGTGASARFTWPTSVAVTAGGTVYVGDGNNTLRMVTPAGVVTTLAGSPGVSGTTDGTGGAARFGDLIQGLALDGSGNVLVADTYNHTIRQVTPGGVVTTLAGIAGQAGATNGALGVGKLSNPSGLAVSAGGTLYIADYGNHTIRSLTAGTLATFAGAAGTVGSTDGTGSAASFNNPIGLALHGSGKLYVVEAPSHTIRGIDSGAVVALLAGTANAPGNVDATGASARFHQPAGVAVDPSGNLVIADSANGTLRKVTPAGVVTTYIAP